VGGWCNTGFTSVNTVRQECLKLKPNMEIIASRLEMRRYAALMGATVEWNKVCIYIHLHIYVYIYIHICMYKYM
jgi:hypothetical protein